MSWQIAIDGPAGAGKSTIAKKVAKKLGFEYIDTGAMYRAVTLKAINLAINMDQEQEFMFLDETRIDFINQVIYLDGKDVSTEIRSLEVTNNVSLVSKHRMVREKLVQLQRDLAASKNIIMDGRDIGSVVLPNANLKIFLYASVEERALRRMKERQDNNCNNLSLKETINEIESRDYKDSHRDISPLVKTGDAIEIDSSKLSVETVVNKIISLVFERGYKMEKLEQKTEVVETEEVVNENNEQVIDSKAELNVENEPVVEDVVVEEQDEDAVDATDENEEYEEEEVSQEEQGTKYKELQLVQGTVVKVIDEKPEEEKKGKVIKAKEERVLIRLDDGAEGFLFKRDTAEIREDEELFDLFFEGDRVEVIIKKIYPDGGKMIFSTILLKMRNEISKFNDSIKNHEILTAKVTKNIKVGLLLKYEDFSCLLPSSQINVSEEERAALVGQEIDVTPIRIDYGRIRLIVSHNVANAIKKRADKTEFIKQVEVDQVYEGTVKNIESYGAFVEIGNGVEGLLHISEIDHNRVYKIDKYLKSGDTVKVKVIKIEKDHIGLSRKALLPNFWQAYVEGKQVGDVVNVKVSEINNSGIVLQLNEEITGFLPKSEFSWERDVYVEDFVTVGDEMDAKIIEIDASKKRIIFSKKQLTENPWDNLTVKVGDVINVTVTRALKDGFKVDYNGASGYLAKASIRSIPADSVAEGDVLKVRVRVLDAKKTRLVVSHRDAEEQQQKENYNKYMKSQEKMSNTFGDLIADRLNNMKK